MSGGVLVINKPRGISSFEVVKEVSKSLLPKNNPGAYDLLKSFGIVAHGKKIPVGHAGTLDPEATGVLVVCVGEATKLVPYLMDGQKEYMASILLGVRTDTDDLSPESKVLYRANPPLLEQVDMDQIQKALLHFVGHIEQAPPVYSALKVEGKRMYELARDYSKAGLQKEADLLSDSKKRTVFVEAISQVEFHRPYVLARIVCHKGTYIRSIARDLGEMLGVYGTLSELQRTRVGSFGLDKSVSLEEIQKGHLPFMSMRQAVAHLPCVDISKEEARHVFQGKVSVALSQRLDKTISQEVNAVFLVRPSGDLSAVVQRKEGRFMIGRGFGNSEN